MSDIAATIFIIDDHPVMRMGLTCLINSAEGMRVIGEAGSAGEALGKLDEIDPPDLILVDVSLPDQNGLELLKELKLLCPDSYALVISSHDEEVYAERVLRAGGRGYITKDRAPEKLVEAVRQVLSGGIFLSQAMTAKMMEVFAGGEATGSSVSSLTDRELEVYRLIGEGDISREIAAKLGVSVRTIDAHRTHIKDKLGLRDAAELSYRAIRWVESQS
ncbi:response regulator transcription factor [Verrucomicrobiales bacterium BCK34]|nr:response regulator transcription factor [Verrucomicrobiales bacterium BCK34]